MVVLSLGGVAAVLAGFLVFGNLNGNLVYYLTPTEAVEQRADFPDGRRFRLAGQVAEESVRRHGDVTAFDVGIGYRQVAVRHDGAPPQLFREGIEVVVEGAWDGDVFRSDTMLVKHDENYAPPAGAAARGEDGS
jgi:cytochrome c-type biogenesis protein CcmE